MSEFREQYCVGVRIVSVEVRRAVSSCVCVCVREYSGDKIFILRRHLTVHRWYTSLKPNFVCICMQISIALILTYFSITAKKKFPPKIIKNEY